MSQDSTGVREDGFALARSACANDKFGKRRRRKLGKIMESKARLQQLASGGRGW